MSTEERLHQMEKRLEQLEEKTDLGGDIEEVKLI